MGLSKRSQKYQKEILLGDLSKEAQRLLFNTEDPIKDICAFESKNETDFKWTYLIFTDEGSPNTGGEYSLEAKTENVQLEEREIQTPVTKIAVESFSKELLQALANEYKKDIKDQIFSYLFSKQSNPMLSIYKEEPKKGFWLFFKSIFKRNKKVEQEPYLALHRKILSKIFSASNMVASNGRRGPANVIICNGQMGTVFQDSAFFTYVSTTNTISNMTGIYPIGQIAGMIVYVDPYMNWNDTRVLVGRFTKDEFGIKLFYKPNDTECTFLTESVQSHRASLKTKDKLIIPKHFENQFEICEFKVDLI